MPQNYTNYTYAQMHLECELITERLREMFDERVRDKRMGRPRSMRLLQNTIKVCILEDHAYNAMATKTKP